LPKGEAIKQVALRQSSGQQVHSYRLSEVLNSKGIKHWLDDGRWRGHDWNYWQDMLPYYLSIAV
jgi:esterase/lipase superfamily enzyme